MISGPWKSRLLRFALFVAPIVLVKLVGGTVVNAVGAEAKSLQPAQAMPVVGLEGSGGASWTDEQQHAAQRVQELSSASFGGYSLLYRAAPTSDPVIETGPRLQVTVGAIINTPSGVIALINDRPRRVGDLIDEGRWRISAIDLVERAVEFTEVDGDRVERRVVPTLRDPG